jgi:hypothetical protein
MCSPGNPKLDSKLEERQTDAATLHRGQLEDEYDCGILQGVGAAAFG